MIRLFTSLLLLLLILLIVSVNSDRLQELLSSNEKIGLENLYCILLSENRRNRSEIHYKFINISSNGESIKTGKMHLKSSRFKSRIESNDNENTKLLNKHNDWYHYLDSYDIYITTKKPKLKKRSHLSNIDIENRRGCRYYEPRDYDMLVGFNQTIVDMKLRNQTVPSIFALYTTRDHAEDKLHLKNSSCVVRDEDNRYIASYIMPPIFSQNRYFNSTTYVLMPDFTYFSTFHNFHNRGNPKTDIWFAQFEKALSKKNSFQSKKSVAMWRGTYSSEVNQGYDKNSRFYVRAWNSFRSAVVGCDDNNLIDTNGKFIKKEDMCSKYKALVSIPGFGVWTWGLKFQLLCDSINILIPPSITNGETWETRETLGLKPYEHYLPLTGNISTVCDELNNHMKFIRDNEHKALDMINAKRNIIFNLLSREQVLYEFAQLLLTYSNIYESYDWAKFPFDYKFHR